MRRRWPLILGGVVVLGVATVLALALLVPRAPFRFLDGKEEVTVLPPHLHSSQRWYSFPADWATTTQVADRELRSKGFVKLFATDRIVGYATETYSTADVLINNNLGFMPGEPNGTLKRMEGHVAIRLSRIKHWYKPTLWDRIKAVFGL